MSNRKWPPGTAGLKREFRKQLKRAEKVVERAENRGHHWPDWRWDKFQRICGKLDELLEMREVANEPLTRAEYDEIWRSAVHEAGHALSFLISGAGIARVAINAEGGVATAKRTGDGAPWHHLTGEAAERVLGPKRGFHRRRRTLPGSKSDAENARHAVRRELERRFGSNVPSGQIKRRMRKERQRAKALIQRHRKAVYALAKVLMRDIEVDGDTARHILLQKGGKRLCNEAPGVDRPPSGRPPVSIPSSRGTLMGGAKTKVFGAA